ncbi:MAG: Crp/Fnr family transcriptional regulator [Deltaproteobacteria bacterium]|nr:MAG: Crp/Fnr family transcriptional regulator [Deltaproteobacteria bacterium]
MPASTLDLLRNSSFFADLDEPALRSIADLAIRVKYPSGAAVFFQHDLPDALYAVLEGSVRVRTLSEDGQELVLNHMNRGDVFGEIALMDGLPRTADCIAETDAVLARIPRTSFLQLLQREPTLAVQLIEVLCARIRYTSTRVEEQQFLTAGVRLARRLLALSATYGRRTAEGTLIDQHLPQAELAAMIGVTRQTANGHLQELQGRGWIRVRRARVIITDRWGLERYAQGADR